MCAQLCLTLCDPTDWSPRGSSVHGIFQERILEQVATSYSKGSFWPRDQTCISRTGRQIRYHRAPCYLYRSVDLSHNVPLLSVPFAHLGSKRQAGITSYTPWPCLHQAQDQTLRSSSITFCLPVAEAGHEAPTHRRGP